MCLPVIGGIISGIGSLASGMAQAATHKANARALEYEAQGQRNAGSYESARQDERNQRLTGQQVTATAANGLDLSGSPVDVIVDSRTQGELDKQMIRANWQHKSNMSQYQAKVEKMNAKSAKIGAVIGAISPVFNSMTGPQGAFG